MKLRSVSLKNYSSLRIGGEGKLVEVSSVEELKEAIVYAKSGGLRVHILGEGANSYFGNDLSEFLFIKMVLKGIETEEKGGEIFLSVSAGEVWDDIVKMSVERQWWGIENLSYIPGTVGAAPVQNIGAYGVELAEVFVSLQALDVDTLEIVELGPEECAFGYRDSIFKYEKEKYAIVSVTLRLYREPHPVLFYKPLDTLQGVNSITPQMVRELVIETRKAKLPDWKEFPNAGSFFKNPIVDLETSEYLKNLYEDMPAIQVPEGYKIPTAWLVEHIAEMKGVRMGDLGTWPKQPLVVVNYGKATAGDLDLFTREIQQKIDEKTGIVLEQEVNRVG